MTEKRASPVRASSSVGNLRVYGFDEVEENDAGRDSKDSEIGVESLNLLVRFSE